MRRTFSLAATTILSLILAACSSGAGTTASSPISAGASSSAVASASTSSPTAPASAAASATGLAEATPDPCTSDQLAVVTPGKLTIGTDNPAYPPYFMKDEGGKKTDPWELGDPTNGTGFESAVGYAIADQLGFKPADVTWVVVPFTNSFAPGAKTFDFDLNQVSFKAQRAQTADLSTGYYFGNQSLVVLKNSPLAKVTSIAALKGYTFGAQVGTTSYDAIGSIIAPTADTKVYDSNDAAIEALKVGTIDGIVVDLPTADFITNVQLDGSTIVGQFDAGTPEYFSAVLAKDSPLTDCVNAAIAGLTEAGTLKTLASTWLPFQDSVPVFKP